MLKVSYKTATVNSRRLDLLGSAHMHLTAALYAKLLVKQSKVLWKTGVFFSVI